MIELDDFKALLYGRRPLLDVRAPIEFAAGHIPGAINIPLLNDDERAQVGTAYKQQGSQTAIELGHKLVSGDVKQQRLDAWKELAAKHSDLVITCFRGGMRSELVQTWLRDAGFDLPRVKGGYKALRQYLLNTIEQESKHPLLILSGATGAGKTDCLRAISFPNIDLELFGNHRGSAFGGFATPQPAQSTFENSIAIQMLRLKTDHSISPWLVEDESRMLGSLSLPEALFLKMRAANLVVIDEPIEVRVENTYREYVFQQDLAQVVPSFLRAVEKISPKLGSQRAGKILVDIRRARNPDEHKCWIAQLLNDYYDPAYQHFIKKWAQKIIFKGTRAQVEYYLLKQIKICQRCGVVFGCGANSVTQDCWCKSYPPLQTLPKDLTDCMCAGCLQAELKKTDHQN